MNVKVKICGIRSMNAAQAAVDAGADYVGFNFVPSSKRYLDPGLALEIKKKLQKKIQFVGVFQNESVEKVNAIADMLELDFVQLHGEEDASYIKRINRKIIKKEDTATQNEEVAFFLLDRKIQGQGNMVNLNRAKEIAQKFPVFFAGGLTPENVYVVVKAVRPYAVDVAGGVETDGNEDVGKIKEFIKNAKEKRGIANL